MIIDYFRKNKQNQLIAASSYADIPFELLQNNISEDNIQNSIIEQDQMRELKYLLTLLPAEQREVVFLRYYNDMSFKEIAPCPAPKTRASPATTPSAQAKRCARSPPNTTRTGATSSAGTSSCPTRT